MLDLMETVFNCLRNRNILPHSGCTIYIPANSVGGFPFLHNLSSILFVDFLMRAVLTSVRWYLIAVWVSRVFSTDEPLFVCLLAI